MVVFGSSMSPYVRKVLAFAAEKQIEVEARRVAPASDNVDFRAASPFGKMPALQDGDFRISDSSAIVAYFEALPPTPNLIPLEPRARARAIWFDEFADTIFFACVSKMFFNRIVAPISLGRPGDLALAAKAESEELPLLLDYIEGQLTRSGFLVEDRLTLADIAVASPFTNLAHCRVDIGERPNLKAYVDGILSRPSFAVWVARESAFLVAHAAGKAASYSHPE
jgi:glutathione S-transferase